MALCRILDKDYFAQNKFLHFALAGIFKNVIINDTTYYGKLDDLNTSYTYSVLIYFEDTNLVDENLYVDFLDARQYKNTREIVVQVESLYNRFKQPLELQESVVVWDLDETLINDDGTPTSDKLEVYLKLFRNHFKRMVVWSHGDPAHVFGHLNKLNIKHHFDMVITRSYREEYGKNKGIGYVLKCLNKKFKTTQIYYSCLIDDKPENFKNDYTFYLRLDPTERDHSQRFNKALRILPERIEKYVNHGMKMFGDRKFV